MIPQPVAGGLGVVALALSTALVPVTAATLDVGPGHEYANLRPAARDAQPGDTILMHAATYEGDQWIEDLAGTPDAWIYIIGERYGDVVVRGGTGAWILVDPAYLHIEHIVFDQQTHNGLNLHDGDSYETPAHHVRFVQCRWQRVQGSGNHDLLKLSGLDDFEIIDCEFIDGTMGSGIDMVGCHRGLISQSLFQNTPGGAIQAKGGSSDIVVERNMIVDYGIRGVNAGGSTDLPYFRPRDATAQASGIRIYANTFVGGDAAVAFAGAVNSEAINNTIVDPGSFVVRILQEQTEDGRFAPCGDNSFVNNLVYMSDRLWEIVNIGPDTRASTFQFSNNLWYTEADPSHRPNFPEDEPGAIYGQDPGFVTENGYDYAVTSASPAFAEGLSVDSPSEDYLAKPYASARTIGAFEVASVAAGSLPRRAVRPASGGAPPSPASAVNLRGRRIRGIGARQMLFDGSDRTIPGM